MENKNPEFEKLEKEYWEKLVGPYRGKIVDFSTEEGYHLFYNYLRQNMKEGKLELRIAFQGFDPHFIIHPLGKNGETLDFTLTTESTI